MTTKWISWGSASAAVKGAGAGARAAAFVPRQLAAPAAGGRPPARRPPTIARGEGSCAVPETLTSSLGRRCRRPRTAELGAPTSRPRSGRSAGPRQQSRTRRRGRGAVAPTACAARGSCARVPGHAGGPGTSRRRRVCHGGGAHPRPIARALGLGLPGPLLRPPPRLHLLRPVDLRLLLLDRRPRAVMGTGTRWRRVGAVGRGGHGSSLAS